MRVPGLQRLLAYALIRLHAYGTAPLGRARSHRQTVAVWTAQPLRWLPRVAVVCHYDPCGRLRADLLHHLQTLAQSGRSVVLVSNSGTLQPQALAAARAVCAAVLVRRNIGGDFCAWRDAMERFSLPRPETRQVLLANDSVYGPLAPLGPLLDRIEDAPGLWGMTDNAQRGYHLQSYFLLAQHDVLHSTAWQRFWRGVRPLHSKWLVIGRYEIGLTRCIRRAGFRCRALFPQVRPGYAPPADNPMLEQWRQLLMGGMPFIKRELLRDNPTGRRDLPAWQDTVAQIAGPAMVRTIEQDLATPTGGGNGRNQFA